MNSDTDPFEDAQVDETDLKAQDLNNAQVEGDDLFNGWWIYYGTGLQPRKAEIQ